MLILILKCREKKILFMKCSCKLKRTGAIFLTLRAQTGGADTATASDEIEMRAGRSAVPF